jgi:hypothetical protein
MEVDSVLPADPAAASDTVISAYRPTAGRTQPTAIFAAWWESSSIAVTSAVRVSEAVSAPLHDDRVRHLSESEHR